VWLTRGGTEFTLTAESLWLCFFLEANPQNDYGFKKLEIFLPTYILVGFAERILRNWKFYNIAIIMIMNLMTRPTYLYSFGF
jgi:hypothetical protein